MAASLMLGSLSATGQPVQMQIHGVTVRYNDLVSWRWSLPDSAWSRASAGDSESVVPDLHFERQDEAIRLGLKVMVLNEL